MPRKRVGKKDKTLVSATQREGTVAQASKLRFVLAAVALCVLTVAAYGNSLANGFVWDDHEQIVMNPYLKSGAPLAPLFTGDVRFAHQGPSVQTRVYRPLQLLTYRVVEEGFGGEPEAFHAVSVLFAVCGALAAFWMFWLLTRRFGVSFAAAALFTVHPIHTEAVDWIAALPDLGVGLFVLLAFSLFLQGRQRPASASRGAVSVAQPWVFPSLSLLAFAAALLWKETAVVFPVLVATYVAVTEKVESQKPGRESVLRALKQSAVYWLVLAVYLAVRFAALGSLTAGQRTWTLSAWQFLLNAMHLMMLYWGKLLLPVGLNAYTVFHPLRSIAELSTLASTVFVLAAVSGVVCLLRRASLGGFAAVWVFVALLPAMDLNALGRNPFAERYLYLPSAGFCLLLVLGARWLIERLPEKHRRAVGVAILLLVLAVFTTETVERNGVWKDDSTLFGETLKLSPDAAFVRNMVAASQAADSEENYEQAIALAGKETPPDRLNAVAGYKGLASIYADHGQFDRALQELGLARQIAPDDPDMAGEEGLILAQMGRGGEAEGLLKKALAVQSNNENVLSALGAIAREEQHDLPAAAGYFIRALAVHPQEDTFSASQHNNLGGVYADEDRFAEAIAELKLAIAQDPSNAEYHDNMASALAATGNFAEARAEAQTALQIAPNDANAQGILQRLNQQR
jgi:protein O-mannosyl-transferase